MLKAVFLLPRRKDLTRQEFLDFWHETHLPLTKDLPGLRRCVFSEVLSSPDGELPCDGMVELWWDDIESVRGAIDSPQAKVCEESLAHFVDLPHWVVFLSREDDHG